MKALILSSASVEIDKYYLEQAKKISSFLAENNFDLIFGGSCYSMMGCCYEEFTKRGRTVYAFTTKPYVDQLEHLKEAISIVVNTTFDLKKLMFQESDIIVCLAGGIGTLSEILAYIEEKRSNAQDKPIIIYDENEFYKHLMQQLEKCEQEKFVSTSVKNQFIVVHNETEFKNIIYQLKERG